MVDSSRITHSQVTSYVQNAQPEELVQLGKTVLTKIAALDSSQRTQFNKSIRSDTLISRMLEPQTV